MPTTKRRLWQIHLSTAIVLTLIAGGALWLNMTPWYDREVLVADDDETAKIEAKQLGYPWYVARGWPLKFMEWIDPPIKSSKSKCEIYWLSLAFDLAIALCALLAVSLLLEHLHARRESKA